MKNFSELIILKDKTLIDALNQLNKTAKKILFVVDKQNRLIGSLTDGDIRRWILKGGDAKAGVDAICYKNTYYVGMNYKISNVKKDMESKKIIYVPVIDDAERVIEFLVNDSFFAENITIKPIKKLNANVVIMAGGKGTRLDPFTKILPKTLIPIGEKTILERIIEKFQNFGVNHFYLSINYKANIIKSYFEEIKPKYKISYIYENKPLGTIGALRHIIEGKIKNREIILTNCDIIVEADYFDILKFHKKNRNDITVVASLKNYRIPYGVCKLDKNGLLFKMEEKPKYNFLVNTGMYVINLDMIEYIPKEQMFHATELIETASKDGKKIGVYPISEDAWIDIGEWDEYKKVIESLRS